MQQLPLGFVFFFFYSVSITEAAAKGYDTEALPSKVFFPIFSLLTKLFFRSLLHSKRKNNKSKRDNNPSFALANI